MVRTYLFKSISVFLMIVIFFFTSSLHASELIDISDLQNLIKTVMVRNFPYAREDLLFRAKKAFINLSYQQGLLVVKQDCIRHLKSHYEGIAQLFEKGLLSKFELIKLETVLNEQQLELLRMTDAISDKCLDFNNLLGLDLSKKTKVKPLHEIVYDYSDFDKWIKVEMYNRGFLKYEKVSEQGFDETRYFASPDEIVFLNKYYNKLATKKRQVDIVVSIISSRKKILELEKIRFTNSIIKSNDVVAAILKLYDIEEEKLELLHVYYSALNDVDYFFNTLSLD